MTRLRQTLFNIFIYANLIFALATFSYAQLPVEYQFLNELDLSFVFLGGGSTGLIGSVGLWFKSTLNAKDKEYQEQLKPILEQNLNTLKEILSLREENKVMRNMYEGIKKEQSRTNRLLETQLRTKQDDELVNKRTKELIEGVLNED